MYEGCQQDQHEVGQHGQAEEQGQGEAGGGGAQGGVTAVILLYRGACKVQMVDIHDYSR